MVTTFPCFVIFFASTIVERRSNLLYGLCTSGGVACFNQKWKMEQGKGEIVPSVVTLASHIECGAHHCIGRKRGSGEGRTTGLLWHMRWRVWLGNIMEMYRTANPGMTVRPRPWPRGVASSTELLSIKWHLSSGAGRRGFPLLEIQRQKVHKDAT